MPGRYPKTAPQVVLGGFIGRKTRYASIRRWRYFGIIPIFREQNQQRSLREGFDDFVARPVDVDTLPGKRSQPLRLTRQYDPDTAPSLPAQDVPTNRAGLVLPPAGLFEGLLERANQGDFG
ncbi:MAG: hypothetical protein H7Z72_18980 [Bacteroidetes bacterium]|nr:hypothetical protein [Fibrella sp.]